LAFNISLYMTLSIRY